MHLNQGMVADGGDASGLSTDSINSNSSAAVDKTDAAAIVAPEDMHPLDNVNNSFNL